MKQNYKTEIGRIEKALGKSKSGLPLALKLRMSHLILHLMQQRKNFGILIILGWKNTWKRYIDTPDASQDIFLRRHINIMKIENSNRKDIRSTINFDGAILIDSHGNVLHSGTMIEGLRPRATAQKIAPKRSGDLSARFGFKRKVHMRHITAITGSYTFKNTTIFTVSEETDDLHIFENGKIAYSTVRGE